MVRKIVNFAVSAADTAVGDLTLYGPVGFEFDGFTDREVADALAGAGDVETLNVFINSPGGDVFQGEAIYTQLVRHSANVTVNVDGLAASAASLIAMAGDRIVMSGAAQMMIHNPFMLAIGDAENMRRAAESLDRVQGTLADIYADRSGADRDDVLRMMAEETWFTAEGAVEAGFATEIASRKSVDAAVPERIYAHYRRPPDTIHSEPKTDPAYEPGFSLGIQELNDVLARNAQTLADHQWSVIARRVAALSKGTGDLS